jgi:hypothetical protein
MHPQPRNHFARGQAFLLRRVDLPNLVNFGRSQAARRRRPTRRRRRSTLIAEPALQRSFAGRIAIRKELCQLDPQSTGAPARVHFAQQQRPLMERVMLGKL